MKEMMIDFHRKWTKSVDIQGMDTEIMMDYKYLSVNLNTKLDWTYSTNSSFQSSVGAVEALRVRRRD